MVVKTGFEKLQDMGEKVVAIQKAVRDLRETGIREDILIVIIQGAAGNVKGKPVPVSFIKATLNGLDTLEDYVFGKDGR